MGRTSFFWIFFVYSFVSYGGSSLPDTILFNDSPSENYIGKYVKILEDKTNSLRIEQVLSSNEFKFSKQAVPNLGISNSAFWLSFNIKNVSKDEEILLEIANPSLDEIELYKVDSGGVYSLIKMGEYLPFDQRAFDHPSYVFNLKIKKNANSSYYIKCRSNEDMSLPIKVGSVVSIMDSIRTKDSLFGLYTGIMMVMFLYNTFIYITTKDKSYLYYIIYILFVTLTQACFQGYTFQFLWSDSPWIAQRSIVLLSAFVGISAGEFARAFLDTNTYLRKLSKSFRWFYLSYFICIVLSIFFKGNMQLLNATALLISLYILTLAIILAKRGQRSAKFFLIAWIIFLIGVIVFALKNAGILPYNSITIYTMPAGSAIEAILLSFALADRINILKKDKEDSQRMALDALLENEKLIKEQNVVLEQKVEERTIELQHTNEELSNTLSDLKNTQTQLVSVEKMASLGQLTAGIAHEINNPINFVSANVKPLKLDINDVLGIIEKYESIDPKDSVAKFKEVEDYKKSIDYEYLKKEMAELLSGIEEGAKRTAEIVRGLKNFSRLDESDIKTVNINEGIESTLVLLRNIIPEDTKLNVQLGDVPKIECLPGKLNQVFMNLLNNAIYALTKVEAGKEKELSIKTFDQDEHVHVIIEDTGIGMTPEVKSKIFDPFFTTKEVGEGTGLGMSIVFKIIESHQAKIEIESEAGKGTKILLILNKKINLI
ncbi:MAG: pgtB [Bacteroidetes bacterium]|jgi:signal transduction histidine kinase|nr:pgtB [Bacteroidota bacterium]MDF2452732.1 pgtB [Bacteroidota bacterium]